MISNSGSYTSTTHPQQLYQSSIPTYSTPSSLYHMTTSSSTATSSKSALSGLAQLVHSHPSKPFYVNKNLTTVNPTLSTQDHPNLKRFSTRRGLESDLSDFEQNKDIDIGLGAYNSSLKHVTASLNQVKREIPFR